VGRLTTGTFWSVWRRQSRQRGGPVSIGFGSAVPFQKRIENTADVFSVFFQAGVFEPHPAACNAAPSLVICRGAKNSNDSSRAGRC
jgi:hypothetical protein